MSLTELIKKNNKIYHKWSVYGRPEAFGELNDSNRELIKAYMKNNPEAVGYKFYEGIVNLKNNPLYNFCCDFVFDRSLIDEVLKTDPYKIDKLLTLDNSICLVWS